MYVGMIGGKSPEGLNFSNLWPQLCVNGWDLKMGGGSGSRPTFENLFNVIYLDIVVNFNPFCAVARYAIYHQKMLKN